MTVIEKIQKAKKPLFTFELLPPLKGHTIENMYNAIDRLMEFQPAYINFTAHQDEVVYKQRADGLVESKVVRKRPGTIAIAAAVKFKYDVTVVPHIICGGFTKEETENALIDMDFLGIHDILALRGDPEKGKKRFTAKEGGHSHTSDLVEQVANMNQGKYLDGSLENAMPTKFCMGVAGYPEKHFEAPNLEKDLYYLKKKVEAGASYIVTQMFFINQKYFDFVKACRNMGIEVPIVPGIKPISTLSDIDLLPQTFNIDLPSDLYNEVKKCRSNEEARQVGIEWTIKQSEELIQFGVPGIHYYTLGRSDNVAKIVKAVF